MAQDTEEFYPSFIQDFSTGEEATPTPVLMDEKAPQTAAYEPESYVSDINMDEVLSMLQGQASSELSSIQNTLPNEEAGRTSREQALQDLENLRQQNPDVAPTTSLFPTDYESLDSNLIQELLRSGPADTQIAIRRSPTGEKTIEMQGSPTNTEFQGFGRYATPEEFKRLNPDGFAKTNPGLAAKMEQEAQAKQQAQAGGPAGFTQTLEGIRAKLSTSTSFEERIRLLGEMKNLATPMVQSAHDEALKRAGDQLGVTRLEQQLQMMQKNDAARGIMSKQTLEVEKMLQTARSQQEVLAQRMVRSNPKLTNMLSALDNEIKIQSHQTEQMVAAQNRETARKEAALDRKLEKEEFQKEAAADIIQGLDKTAIQTYTKVFPQLVTTKPDGTEELDAVAFAKSLKINKDFIPLLNGEIPPTQYVTAAALGNKAAERMAIIEQNRRTGQPIESVQSDLDYVKNLVGSKQFLYGEAVKYGEMNRDELKKLQTADMLKGKSPSKDELAQQRLEAVQLASRIMYKKDMQRMEDISSWPVGSSPLADPKGKLLYDSMTKDNGRSPSLLDFARSYVGEKNLTTAERESRQSMLTKGYKEAAKVSDGSLFHAPIDQGLIDNNITKIKTAVARKVVNENSLIYKVGSMLGDVLGDSSNLYASSSPAALVSTNKQQSNVDVLGAMDSFFAGLAK